MKYDSQFIKVRLKRNDSNDQSYSNGQNIDFNLDWDFCQLYLLQVAVYNTKT